MEKTLSITVDQEGVAILTLSRPKLLNALTAPMFQELAQRLREIEASQEIRAVLLTGQGRGFCAGLDLGELKDGYGGQEAFYRHIEAANRLIVLLAELDKPVVVAVNGIAAGSGMNIVLAADLAVAATDATFSQSFGHVGLIPDVGGTFAEQSAYR